MQTKLLDGYETADTESMLGDQPSVYTLSDYREVAGVKLPHKITIVKGGKPYSEVQFASSAVNDANAPRGVPDSRGGQRGSRHGDRRRRLLAPSRSCGSPTVSTFARAYSHNSLVVEFPSYLAVIEAAYTDAQSATLARVLAGQFPRKPIRYAAVTHYHYDHSGGVRGLAAVGATILAAKEHEPMLRPIMDTPHTNPEDALEAAKKAARPARSSSSRGKSCCVRAARTLELYTVTGIPHVEPKVLAFVPKGGVLFQSDLFLSGDGRAGGARRGGTARGGEVAEAQSHDDRRRARRRRSVRGAGEGGSQRRRKRANASRVSTARSSRAGR
jgi:hypothetical protein